MDLVFVLFYEDKITKGDNFMKKISRIVTLMLMLLFLSACSFATNVDKKDFEICVSKCVGADALLPSVADVVNNDRFSYKFYEDNGAFYSCGIVVTEEIEKENFSEKKKQIDELYDYLDEPVYNSYLGMNTVPQVEFEIDNYVFRVIDKENETYGYPNSLGMIATSESESKILYFAFYSQDLDYIEDMGEFVEKNFPQWNEY